MRIVIPLVAFAISLAHVGVAEACEPMPCLPGSVLPSGGTIPANAKALRWHAATALDPEEAAKMVTLKRDGTDVGFELEVVDEETFHVVPKKPWVEGANYTLEAKNACKYLGPKVHASTFSIGPEAKMPETLGALKLADSGKGPLKIGTDSGSCDVEEAAVWADVEVRLSSEAAPWASLIDYAVSVDGKRWAYASTISVPPPRGQSEIGRGKARIYARCASESYAFEGVGEGRHSVEIAGQVLGSADGVVAGSMSVSLDCSEGAAVVGGGAAHPTEDPRDDPSRSKPEAVSEQETKTGPAGAHAKGCNLGAGGAAGWLPLLLVFCGRVRVRRKPAGGGVL